MKQKAIISLLWGTQFEVLRQFLVVHDPMIVLTRIGAINPDMQKIIASTGSTVVYLDDLIDKSLQLPDIISESKILLASLDSHLYTTRPDDNTSLKHRDNLSSIISTTAAENLPSSLWLLESLTKAAEQFDIDIFVTNEDVTSYGKISTAWAKAHNIPSLLLSHSIALVDPYTVHGEVIADILAVFGRRGMEGYLDLGVPEERMVITGNPAWDCYAKLRQSKSECRHQLNDTYGLNSELALVVFGTTYSANLSAHCNEDIFTDSLMAFFMACETLWKNDIHFNAVIKDHPSNRAFGHKRYEQIRIEMNISDRSCIYCSENGREFAVAANVLVGVDSNYLVEGMLARTPVINLMNVTGMLMGPCFEAETGVVEVEWHELADAIQVLLTDSEMRKAVISMGSNRSSHYNHEDGDGRAAIRVAQVMSGMTTRLTRRSIKSAWQDFFDLETAGTVATEHTIGQPELAAMYTNQPRLILDIGCATGSTAVLIKQRFPGSRAWGIELNHSAALIAKKTLDHVLVGRFEDFNLAQEGIPYESIDAVLLADVLQLMYNPWDVMIKLRPYISATGQVVLSIPNLRNLNLIDDLSKGNWTYSNTGLLGISNIRYFTRKEILKFCHETGYRIIQEQQKIDPQLMHLWQKHKGLDGQYNLDIERVTLKGITRDELLELCTLQYHLLLEVNPSISGL